MSSRKKPTREYYLDETKKKLAADNIWLVWWFMDRAVRNGIISQDELDEAAGHVIWHYCLAFDTFDPARGNKLSTYLNSAFWSGIHRYKYLRGLFRGRFTLIPFGVTEEENPNIEDFTKLTKVINIHKDYARSPATWDDIKFLFDNITLSDREREIVYFYHEQQITFKEIAKIIGVSSKTVSSIYYGIVNKIKRYVRKADVCLEDCVA